jgi:hypothetical protein
MDGNTELQVLSQKIKADLIAFAAQKMKEIEAIYETAINNHAQRRSEMMATAEQFCEDAEGYHGNEEYYKQLISHSDSMADAFFSTTEKLLDHFVKTLDLKIQSIKPGSNS